MELSRNDAAARGLRRYVTLVADRVGVSDERCSIQFTAPIGAYVSVKRRLSDFPDRDVALLWDATHGWALAIETHDGADLTVLGYLGNDAVPAPGEVAGRLRRAAEHADARTVDPPPAGPGDVLAARLAGYAGDVPARTRSNGRLTRDIRP